MDVLSFSDLFEMKAAAQSRQMIQVRVCIILDLHGNTGVFIMVSLCSPRITFLIIFNHLQLFSLERPTHKSVLETAEMSF